MECDRPECQECFTCFLHPGDVFLESLGGSNRAKLTAIRNNDRCCHAALRSRAIDVTDPCAVAHVCACMTDTDNVRGSSNLVPRVDAYRKVRVASGVEGECSAADCNIAFTSGISNERVAPESFVLLPLILLERALARSRCRGPHIQMPGSMRIVYRRHKQ